MVDRVRWGLCVELFGGTAYKFEQLPMVAGNAQEQAGTRTINCSLVKVGKFRDAGIGRGVLRFVLFLLSIAIIYHKRRNIDMRW